MGWTKHDDAVKHHEKVLLSTYKQLQRLLSRGLTNPGLAPLFCDSLISHIKMRESLRRSSLPEQPINIGKVLQALPSVEIVLRGNK